MVVYSRVVAMPALMSIVCTILPSLVTIILCLAGVDGADLAGADRMTLVKSFMPYMSLPPRTPFRLGGEGDLLVGGPVLGGAVDDAGVVDPPPGAVDGLFRVDLQGLLDGGLSLTGWLKVTMIGAPTPTFSPFWLGVTSATASSRVGLQRLEELAASAGPPSPAAVAATVYVVAGFSVPLDTHRLLASSKVPSTSCRLP